MRSFLCLFLAFAFVITPYLLTAEEKGAVSVENKPAATTKQPADDAFKAHPKSRIMELLPPTDILYFNYTYQPDNDIRKIDDYSFDLHEYRVGFNPMIQLDGELYAGIGVNYTAYNFRFDFDGETDNRTVHAIDFPISMAWIGEQWMVQAALLPGIKSDCRGFNRHDMQVNANFLVGYLFHPNFLFEVGLALANDFGDLVPVPLIGLEWKAVPNVLDMSILIPFYAKINLHPIPEIADSLTISMFYELDGDQFRMRYRDSGEVFEDDTQFTFYRIGVGFEYAIQPGLVFKLLAGGTAEGEYEFRGLAVKDKGRIDGTFFLTVGITLNDLFFDDKEK